MCLTRCKFEPLSETITCINDKFFVSYDVNSLFTNIPLKETVKLAVNLIKTLPQFENIKWWSPFATCKTHFLFNGNFYDQIDGVAMGFHLAPVLANLFMGHNEKLWIENFQGIPPFYYRDMSMTFFQFLIIALKQKNFLIISIQDTLTLSLTWRLKLIKSFPF